MKCVLIAMAAAAALAAAPALAQEHPGGHKGTQPAHKPMDMTSMTPEEMHKHCSMSMGARMQGRPKHDHSAEKSGSAPAMKSPSDAEMKAMHEKCAAMMAADKKAPAPAKP